MSLFIATAIVLLLFGLWAQLKVKRTFDEYSRVRPRNGMNGAEAGGALKVMAPLARPVA